MCVPRPVQVNSSAPAHRDGSRLGIGAGDAADQEVSLAGFGLVLVDDDAQVHAAGEQFLLRNR
jgi:hypothetical protein